MIKIKNPSRLSELNTYSIQNKLTSLWLLMNVETNTKRQIRMKISVPDYWRAKKKSMLLGL